MEAESCKEMEFPQWYTDHRQQNSLIKLKKVKKKQNMEAKIVLSDYHTCNIGKQGCISPTTHGRCDASRLPRGEGAMVQGPYFNLVSGHSLELSSGI